MTRDEHPPLDDITRQRVLEVLFPQADQPHSLGRYTVIETIAQGTTGTVVRAYDREVDRPVALKLWHSTLDDAHATRLRREAQAVARVSHPNLAQLYDVGEIDGQLFVATEFIRGQTLQQWLQQQPRPDWRESVRLFIQLGEGLAAAHGRGLIHRDFTPSHAIIDDEGRPRVLTFGLVEVGVDDMEPLGHHADPRDDQFSFCVALYEAVYGQHPFPGSAIADLMESMRDDAVHPPPKGTKVPGALRKALLRGLAADPDLRWPSMAALLHELRIIAAPRGSRWLTLAIGTGLLMVGGGLWASRFAQ